MFIKRLKIIFFSLKKQQKNLSKKKYYLFFLIFEDGGGFGQKFFLENSILDKYLKLYSPKVFFILKPEEV